MKSEYFYGKKRIKFRVLALAMAIIMLVGMGIGASSMFAEDGVAPQMRNDTEMTLLFDENYTSVSRNYKIYIQNKNLANMDVSTAHSCSVKYNNSNDATGAQSDGNVYYRGDKVGAWSLLSLIISVIAVIFAVGLVLGMVLRKFRRSDTTWQRVRQRTTGFTIFAVLLGLLTPMVWLLLDTLSLPMALLNKWTLYVAIVFALQLVMMVIHKTYERKREEEKEDK
jgi:hypothetical protein